MYNYRGINFYQIVFAVILSLNGFCSYAQKVKGDSITIAVEPEYNKVSGIHRKLFGENYRRLWATPVTMKVFRLSKEKGGLHIVGKGGGMQTRSLKLKDAEGNDWALRTVQKYPERALPKNLRKTIIKDILQDEVSTSHPFSALVVPPLAEALHIPHSNPQIVYVADDPALGEYRKEYANHVFLFEERDPIDVDNTDNTEKAEKKLEADNDNSVRQKLVLRARLLDFIIGDWDRHEDQWRWVNEKNDTGIVYTPIPRDRDKVFYTTSGIFPYFLSHQRLKSQLQPYTGDIRDINSWNYNARYFDRYFLNQLSENDWKEQVAEVQKLLTNAVIEQAVKRMPPIIYHMSAAKIIPVMEERRDRLEQEALRYFSFLANHVDIPATAKQENFDISEQDSGKVAVTIRKIKKDGTIDHVVYQRTFDPKDTKEIRLYGMGGEDVFKVSGTKPSPIKVRMIGGKGVDSFYVDKNFNNKQKLYVYDRSDKKNVFPDPSLAKIRTGKDTSVNSFNRTSFKYNNVSPVVLATINPDEGVRVIGGVIIEQQGFRKEPYASRQLILGGYSLARNSFLFNYVGDFKQAIGDNDLNINIAAHGPHNVRNFFGVGNNTVFENKDPHDIEYYRNRFNYIDGDVRLFHNTDQWSFSYGLTGQLYYSNAKENMGHFLYDYSLQHPSEDVFKTKAYAGVVLGAVYDNRNSTTNPTKGVYWSTTVNGVTGVANSTHQYGKIFSEFNFYLNPDHDSVLVIANRIAGGTILGHAEFFQDLSIGGTGLRGFHSYRFIGKSAAYDNLEVRLKLFDFTSYLFPGTVGLIGFNDIGRVWVPNESSNQWHDGYGGGLYVIPASKIIIQWSIGISDESKLSYFSFGYRF